MGLSASERSSGPRLFVKHGEVAIVIKNFRRHKMAVYAAVILSILILCAVLAPLLAPYDPYAVNLAGRPQPPSWSHVWGTDHLGRDYLSRALYGARVSLGVGLAAMTVAIIIGTLTGMLAGYFGGAIDQILMRLTDLVMSFPSLIIMMALSSIVGSPSILMVVLIIGGFTWMSPARLVRAEFLSLREREFVTAARSIGCSNARVMVNHMLRNSLSPIIVAASLAIPVAILTEATLSFLGFGIQPPTSSWGNMLNASLRYMKEGVWWIGIYPGVLISVVVLAFNFIGDGIRDAIDPRLRTR